MYQLIFNNRNWTFKEYEVEESKLQKILKALNTEKFITVSWDILNVNNVIKVAKKTNPLKNIPLLK